LTENVGTVPAILALSRNDIQRAASVDLGDGQDGSIDGFAVTADDGLEVLRRIATAIITGSTPKSAEAA